MAKQLQNLIRALVAVAALMFSTTLALADDWTAVRLRGIVLQLIDGAWQPLNRNDVVPDSRVLRTTALGHVSLVRGAETIEVGPNTQIQIYDKTGTKPFTTVKQYFGTVSVEAEVQNVQHFAVDTPYLAAVVKGTRFVVTSTSTGASVTVMRGHVAVEDKSNHSHVMLSVGQSASMDMTSSQDMTVEGTGDLPTVVDDSGTPVTAGNNANHGEGNNGNGNGNGGSTGTNGNNGKGKGKSSEKDSTDSEDS